MKTAKKLLLVIVAFVMAFGSVALLAACNDEDTAHKAGTFNVSWDNYIYDPDELREVANGFNIPVFEERGFGDDVESVGTNYADVGLVVLRKDSGNCYGYSLYKDATFGEGDKLVGLSSHYNNCFLGRTADGDNILYDIEGKTIAKGRSVYTSNVSSATVDGEIKHYLTVVVDNSVEYHEIAEDGSLSVVGLDELPNKKTLPAEGELFTADAAESLFDMFKIDQDEPDSYMKEVYARTYGRTMIFTDKNDKVLSRFEKPLNIGTYLYLNKQLVYSTLTPVDAMATKGFNYIQGDNKYLSKLYTFNIATGRTKELKVDYVLRSSGGCLYNKKTKAHDLVAARICHMTDGVARESDAYLDTVILNVNGEIGFSAQNNPFGMPMAKIGKNYLCATLTDNKFSIVNAKGDLVAYLGNVVGAMQSVLSDGFLVKLDNKLGIIGFDGVVKVGFDYQYLLPAYGNHTLVTDENGAYYAFNLADRGITRLASMLGVDEADISIYTVNNYGFIRVYNKETYTYDFYNLDGKKIISAATSNSFGNCSVFNLTGKKRYMFCGVNVADGDGTAIKYYRVVL